MRKGERKLLKDSIIQYVKENTAKISLEEQVAFAEWYV